MAVMESRRDFLKKTGVLLGGAALLGVTGCAQTVAEEGAQQEVPAYPYPCCEFDLDRVEKLAYEGYYENGCCYGVAYALLTELQDKIGFPFTVIPAEMFANGKEGYVNGSLCGAMGGALGVFGLVLGAEDARALTKQLNDWYTSTPLPIYQPEITAPCQTVSPTINCLDSVSLYMKEAGVERKDPIRKARCGGLSGDVAKKAAELLNIHFGYMAAPVVEEAPAVEETLAENEYIGEAEGFGGPIKVKVTMDGDKIANIEVLNHAETAGISDPAFNTIPQAIIDAQSTEVDVVANATYTSNGIMAAVNDALSKVGK
jgi:uncharacterized protein with FMN-binding domain